MSSRFRIGDLTLDTGRRMLLRDSKPIPLGALTYRMLLTLVEAAPNVVSHDELINSIWDGRPVSPETISQRVKLLRDALSENPQNPRYIELVRGQGYRLLPQVEVLPQEPAARGRTRWPSWVGAAAIPLFVAVAVAFWIVRAPTSAVRQDSSIAVLPFADLSPAGDQQYFADGMAEEILNLLSKTTTLRVIARTSSFSFRGKDTDVRRIAEALGVTTVLEGSVRKAGEHVRITVQLVDAANGYQLWSQTYDRQLDNIFEVQADIATNVVRQLQATLLGSALPRHMPSPEAYAAYLQGNHLFDRFHNDRAIFYYERALQLDEHYAAAMVGLAQARFGYGFGVRADTDVAEARQLIERAIALEPALVEGYVMMARIARIYDFDWTAAEASMTRARELEPGKVSVLLGLGILAGTLGRLDESVASLRQALERDPLNPAIHIELGLAQLSTGNPAAAEASFRTYLELSPVDSRGHYLIARALFFRGEPEKALAEAKLEPHDLPRAQALALVYHALHRKTESDAALRELTEKYAREAAFRIAEVYAYRQEADQAMRWLEQAHRNREGELSRLLQNPLLRALAHDPRYQAFLRKMNLPTDVGSSGLSASPGNAASPARE
jgi:TolB-like protein/DNA-binding winged helix-turn-helix (wHTH) protein/Flp pilus assembly protein TadD